MDHVYRLGRQVGELRRRRPVAAQKIRVAAWDFIQIFASFYGDEGYRSLWVVYRMAQMETARQN